MTTRLTFSPNPHIHTPRTTRSIMLHVLIALLPAIGCAVWFFGFDALRVLLISTAACVAVEWAAARWLLHRKNTVGDLSAVVTGVLLALNLPSSLPWWMIVAGAVMATGVAKMAFGGLGCNIFNPALVGRVFLLISFPVAMTSWPLPLHADSITGASVQAVDGATGPTILGLIKTGGVDPGSFSIADMALGAIPGSIGEVSAAALLVGFVYLMAVKVIKAYIPLAIFAGVALIDVFAGFPVAVDLLSGGLMLGAIFMATDYTTSPMTTRGMILYGLLIGIITASIRRWGAYPEGMSFAILIMNGFTPLIDRYIRPRRFSPRRKEASA